MVTLLKNLLIILLIALIMNCDKTIQKDQKTITEDLSNKFTLNVTSIDTLSFFNQPKPISVSKFYFNKNNEFIYAVDELNCTINIYDPSGTFIKQIGESGQGPGEFVRINGLTFLKDGTLLIFDSGLQRISEFDKVGNYRKVNKTFSGEYFMDDCQIKSIGDSIVFLGLMEPGFYFQGGYHKSDILFKFKYPEWTLINQGGRLNEIYNKNLSVMMGRNFLVSQNEILLSQQAFPLITVYNYDLVFKYQAGILSQNYSLITEGFNGEYNFRNMKKIAKFFNGKSVTDDIFKMKNKIITVFHNIYKQTQLGVTLYQDKSGKGNEYYYQIYSNDMKQYYGEVIIDGKYMGADNQYIYSRIITKENNDIYVRSRIIFEKI